MPVAEQLLETMRHETEVIKHLATKVPEAALGNALSELSDAELESRRATLPWGLEVPLGRALVDMGVKPLTAYRMQLFLYCKQSGNASLWTPNCWVGVDRDRPVPTA